jgi:hypothetical protein
MKPRRILRADPSRRGRLRSEGGGRGPLEGRDGAPTEDEFEQMKEVAAAPSSIADALEIPASVASALPRSFPDRGRSLTFSEAKRYLSTNAFWHYPIVWTEAVRQAVARLIVVAAYRGSRLSDLSYQKRIMAMDEQQRRLLSTELVKDNGPAAGPDASRFGNIVVVKGGPAEEPNAATLPDGSIVVHQSMIDFMDDTAQVWLGSSTPEEGLEGILRLTVDRMHPQTEQGEQGFQFFAPARALPAQVRLRWSPFTEGDADLRRVADSAVFTVVGHEGGHREHRHAAIGMPSTDAVEATKATRPQEAVADASAIEKGLRLGYSPIGLALPPLLFAMFDILSGDIEQKDSDHPSGLDRYTSAYRALHFLKDKRRMNFDGRGAPTEGEPYMTEAMKAELAKLPPPEMVRRFSETVLQSLLGRSFPFVESVNRPLFEGSTPPYLPTLIVRH